MRELHDLAATYDQALSEFDQLVRSGQRQWAARQLSSYPHRDALELAAQQLRVALEADAIQVNSVGDVQQTIAKAPEKGVLPDETPLEHSLCALVMSLCEPAMVSDVQNDPFVANHPARKHTSLTSWASAPIVIEGVCAGTVCALESTQIREWTSADQVLLEMAAEQIGTQVSEWAQDKKYRL